MVHFGTAFSNNTTRLSSRIPSKSMIRGFIGAIIGMDFTGIQQLQFNYSFNWLNEYKSQMIAKNRMVYTSKPTMESVLNSDRWKEGNLVNTVDYIEYLCPINQNRLFFNLMLVIQDEELLDTLYKNAHSPKYPVFLGSAESMVSIKKIEKLDLLINFDVAEFKDMFLGEHVATSYILKETLTDTLRDYKIPTSFAKLYTLSNKIKGKSTFGYVSYENINYSLW